jgi:hypothetical protein
MVCLEHSGVSSVTGIYTAARSRDERQVGRWGAWVAAGLFRCRATRSARRSRSRPTMDRPSCSDPRLAVGGVWLGLTSSEQGPSR